MHKTHRSRKKSLYGKDMIILPIVFCVLIFLICLVVIIPSTASFQSTASLFFSDREKNFSNDYVNIFVPVEESYDESETSAESSQTSKAEPKKQETVNIANFTFPAYGNQFGELIIEDCQIHAKLFFGYDDIALRNGVCIYSGSFIPGYGKTILVAGHNNTYFNGLKYAQKGQIVKIRTNYGNYKYEITDMQIHDENDRSAYDLKADSENLIMYTCYPFERLSTRHKYRYFVYCSKISGPILEK